jgi:hypothetical protein
MSEKTDYLKLVQQCRERGNHALELEDTIEWRRIADACARVVREQDDLSRQKIGMSSIPLDEATRVKLRRQAKAKSLPRRFG